VQRCRDALNLAPHFHSLVIHGVYAADENGQPEFHELPPPEDADVVRVAALVAQRVESLLKRRGLGPDGDSDTAEALGRDEPGLAAIYSASIRGRIGLGPHAGNRVLTVGDQVDGDNLDPLQSSRCATVSGFSVHANVSIDARDRLRLEDLQPDYNQVGTDRMALNDDCACGASMARRKRSSVAELRR
jgi:Putative transposase